MSQIVHITFEKLTGLKGTIEGVFEFDPDLIDFEAPLVYASSAMIVHMRNGVATGMVTGNVIFSHNERFIMLEFLPNEKNMKDYIQHFESGRNFMVKEMSYGGGVTINSQPPN